MGLKKNKRRETNTLLSPSSSFRSSSHRKQDSSSPATSKTTNVGCMSGIFQFIARYHTRRKFLTFGNKKQERNGNIHSPTKPPPGKSDPQLKPEKTVTCQACDHNSTVLQRLPPDHAPPRSSAILPEIQRSSTNKTVNSPRVVERLMGLDDLPAIIPTPAPIRGISPAYEKRRKLLGDLEKCDKDLKALKKIIETVRAAQTPPRMVKMERRVEVEEVESEVGSEGPSPVSVLDHRHLSPGYSKKIMHDQILQQQQKTKQQMYPNKKQGVHHEEKSLIIDHTTTPQPLHFPTRTTQQVLNTTTTFIATGTETEAQTETWSKAMKESVIEVCRIVESGQTQEVRGIGLLLQDFILKELIDDITKDLCNASYLHVYRNTSLSLNLPFDACKRKLFL